MANKIKVGITAGDGAGVGLEVILGALADPRMGELASFVVYGSRATAEAPTTGPRARRSRCASTRLRTVSSSPPSHRSRIFSSR